MQKSISFIFNNNYPIPTGGSKVVFEYANRLVKDGWKVYIIYSYLVKPKHFLSKVYHFFMIGLNFILTILRYKLYRSDIGERISIIRNN